MTTTLRLAAGTLALALPLAAAAGCGAQKRQSVHDEMSSALAHLRDSRSASVTVHLTDSQGSFAKALAKGGDVPPVLATALLRGSITITSDPAGDATFRSLGKGGCTGDLSQALTRSNVSFLVKDDKAELAELRVVAGDLYAHVNLAEVRALAKAGGVADFDAGLDDTARSMGPQVARALADVRAGKWLKLPLSSYAEQLKGLGGAAQPGAGPSSCPSTGLASTAMAAVKPYVKVTDANDDSRNRVLDVRVQVVPAVQALLTALKADTSLPFGAALKSLDPSTVTKDVKPGTAHGQITLHEGHLTGVTVDLESIRQLSKDPGTDSFAGVQLAVDVNDAAPAVQAPSDVSTVDLEKLVQDALGGILGSARAQAGLVGSNS